MSGAVASVGSESIHQFELTEVEGSGVVELCRGLYGDGLDADDVSGLLAHAAAAQSRMAGRSKRWWLGLCEAVWERSGEQISEMRAEGACSDIEHPDVEGRA